MPAGHSLGLVAEVAYMTNVDHHGEIWWARDVRAKLFPMLSYNSRLLSAPRYFIYFYSGQQQVRGPRLSSTNKHRLAAFQNRRLRFLGDPMVVRNDVLHRTLCVLAWRISPEPEHFVCKDRGIILLIPSAKQYRPPYRPPMAQWRVKQPGEVLYDSL